MADPTIKTFCCQETLLTNQSFYFSINFNTQSYITVCLASSSIGMLGAIYQILPRESLTLNHRWYSPSATRGRHIIVWLAIADLFASFGVFMRSFMFNYAHLQLKLDSFLYTILCAVSSAWIQYFYTATWMWTLFYAIDMKLVLRDEVGYPVLYHSIAWLLPAVFTFFGLSMLYFPNIDCHCVSSSKALLTFLPNYLATYFPLATIMILNPILYLSLSNDVKISISWSLAQFTNKERHIMNIIKMKFLLINLAFYLCWFPNLLNGILIWSLWFSGSKVSWFSLGEVTLFLWYLMGLMNPLQAVFNSLVYRKWTGSAERVCIPCWKKITYTNHQICLSNNSSNKAATAASESSPLLSPSLNSTCDSNI